MATILRRPGILASSLATIHRRRGDLRVVSLRRYFVAWGSKDDEIIPGALDGGDSIVMETFEQSETMPEIPGKCAVQCIDKQPGNTIVSIQGDNVLGLAELDEFILSNSSVDQSTPTEQITCPSKNDPEYSLRSIDLTVLQPLQVDNELDYQNDENLDDLNLVDDLFYDSDRDPEYVPSSESDSSAINGTLQQDLPNVQSDENHDRPK
ncbi:hypothetical protein J6590_010110 [Homalodisca vitripennis]|nr:hypothetical protein J6590_010110 [Homalodisca vitripennis]